MPLRRTAFALTVLLLAVPCARRDARGDIVVPRSGKPVQGAIVRRTDAEVVVNIYGSRNPDVVNPEHLVRLPLDKVKSVEERPRPEVEVWRRSAQAKTPEAWVAVADYAREHKLKAVATMAHARALALDGDHAAALKGLGGRTRWASERKGNPLLDAELQGLLERLVQEDDPQARVALHAAIKERGSRAKPHELERWRRSRLQPTGYQRDRPVTYRSDARPGAVYTLFVPPEYTPARTWPLIIGLHGGGPDGKQGDEVVGSGPSAMNFYQQHAARHGYLVACPTALVAGWSATVNEELVRDVITELRLLYHIDIDRIYLTGHSMGGFGTWALGPRLAEDLAAIAPMAGGGGTIGPLVDTRTPVFIFHGADDRVVGPSSDRSRARQLLGTGHDFVYTELDKVGHGFPASVQQELFDFFGPRRRYDKKSKHAWPRSSFEGKVSREEALYLGDPLAEIRGETPTLKDLLGAVRRGGGGARAALATLQEHKPEGAAAGLARILGSGAAFDARAHAARGLAGLGAREEAPALRKALLQPASKEESEVASACARALADLEDVEGLAAVSKALEAWTAFQDDKVVNGGLAYSDWWRAASVLVDLVEAWARLATPDVKPAVLEKTLVERVFAPQHAVATSERVPQDPSQLRAALAQGVARAYVRTNAPSAVWDRLLQTLAGDPRAQAAAKSLRP